MQFATAWEQHGDLRGQRWLFVMQLRRGCTSYLEGFQSDHGQEVAVIRCGLTAPISRYNRPLLPEKPQMSLRDQCVADFCQGLPIALDAPFLPSAAHLLALITPLAHIVSQEVYSMGPELLRCSICRPQ